MASTLTSLSSCSPLFIAFWFRWWRMPAPRASPSTFTTVVVRSLQGENRQALQSMPPGATRGRTSLRAVMWPWGRASQGRGCCLMLNWFSPSIFHSYETNRPTHCRKLGKKRNRKEETSHSPPSSAPLSEPVVTSGSVSFQKSPYVCASCVRHRHVEVVSSWDDEGFPGGSDGKESACSAEDLDLIPGLGRSPGEGNDNSLQYSCLENPRGQRSLASYSPRGCKESDMTERLSTHTQLGWWCRFGPGSTFPPTHWYPMGTSLPVSRLHCISTEL